MQEKLIIDQEFLNMTVPITDEQHKILKKSILFGGCRNAIQIWNGIIIDGYKRYEICMDGNVDFEVENINFPSRDDAIIWACQKRIPETERGSAIYKYLIGKEYQSQKRIVRMKRKAGENNDRLLEFSSVSRFVADHYSINHVTVEKYGTFYKKMEEIKTKNGDFFHDMMAGKVHASHNAILAASQLDGQKIKLLLSEKRLKEEKKQRDKNKLTEKKKNMRIKRDVSTDIPLSVGIKEMPAFDPDMELNGLSLTIPAWINSIERAIEKTNFELVSAKTIIHLTKALDQLEWQILLTREILEK